MSARGVVSVALGRGRGVAAWWPSGGAPSAARTLTVVFDADALAGGDGASLGDAMREVRRAVGPDVCAVEVALASPWTSPRVLTLPPMRDDEARTVLARDAARFFPQLRGEAVVAVRAIARGRAAPGRWFAADADARVLRALQHAARDADFTLARVTTAVAAWAHAAGNADGRVFVVDGEAAVVHARAGRITQLRRCRVPDAGPTAANAPDALELAARHALASGDAELVSPVLQATRDVAAWKIARGLFLAGATAVAVAGAVRWWGVQHDLRRLESARDALRPSVAGAIAIRDSLVALGDALGALRRAERDAPHWNARLWALAAVLPRDAYFTAFRGGGDSVQVEGRAASASPVFDALRGARGVVSVRATAPIAVSDVAGAAHEQFSVVVHFGAESGAPR